MKERFARSVYALAWALGHLWATRGAMLYRAVHDGKWEDILEDAVGVAKILESFPSLEEAILNPQGRAALYQGGLLTISPNLPPGTSLQIEKRGDGLVWEHTTGNERGYFRVHLTPTGIVGIVEVRRPQGVAIRLDWAWGDKYFAQVDGKDGARPRHWAFLWWVLKKASEKSEVISYVYNLVAPVLESHANPQAVREELEKAAAAFRKAAGKVEGVSYIVKDDIAWAIRCLDALPLGKGASPSEVSFPEAAHRLHEAVRDAQEILGWNLDDLEWLTKRLRRQDEDATG